MAYDEGLATRARDLIGAEPGLAERKMIGGLAMLLHGNMALGCTAMRSSRAPTRSSGTFCWQNPVPGCSILTGRPTKGWLLVDPPG